jgi:hypothetical protein
LKCIWPQQVCSRGNSTSCPRRSRRRTVARPVSGKSVSLKQVMNSATRTARPAYSNTASCLWSLSSRPSHRLARPPMIAHSGWPQTGGPRPVAAPAALKQRPKMARSVQVRYAQRTIASPRGRAKITGDGWAGSRYVASRSTWLLHFPGAPSTTEDRSASLPLGSAAYSSVSIPGRRPRVVSPWVRSRAVNQPSDRALCVASPLEPTPILA